MAFINVKSGYWPCLIFTLICLVFPGIAQYSPSKCIDLPQMNCKMPPVPFGIERPIVDPAYWPWHASIYWKSGNGMHYICGGVLIGPMTVLTAAHCLDRPRSYSNDLYVAMRASSSKFDDVSASVDAKIYAVSSKDVHPEYRKPPGNFKADIAILTLESPVQNYDSIACLPESSSAIIENKVGEVVGFGANTKRLTGSIQPSPYLKHLQLPIINSQVCAGKQGFDNATMFCAGYLEGSNVQVDTCLGPGDAGDGFVMQTDPWRTQNIVHGILTLGELRCPSAVYFVAVAPYTAWIRRRMEWRIRRNAEKSKICYNNDEPSRWPPARPVFQRPKAEGELTPFRQYYRNL